VIVIHPGASSAARRWPAERFGAVARALHQQGHDVLVTGSGAERVLAERVARLGGLRPAAVLAGELDLLELIALVSDARLLVCGDTGVGHIATATGTSSVVLFGPTPPSSWGPPPGGRHIALWAGNRGDPHADRPDRGLMLITVARVLDAATTLLEDSP
jgi:ADP-heptose:LPS heptosyltransferase